MYGYRHSLSLLARCGGSFDGCLLSDSLEDGVVVVDGVDGVEHRLQTLDAAVVDLGQGGGDEYTRFSTKTCFSLNKNILNGVAIA